MSTTPSQMLLGSSSNDEQSLDTLDASTSRYQLPSPRFQGFALPAVATAFVLFNILIIINSQVTSWGTWDLYANLLSSGTKLYSDLHLPQQPLFFLYSKLWSPVTSQSWLLSLVPPTILVVLFSYAYFAIARRATWPGWQKAVVFAGAASTAIAWAGYSFSDYRAITDIAALYVTILLMRIHDEKDPSKISARWPIVLGCLCGVSFTTRANDGIMLFIATSAILTTWTSYSVRNITVLAASTLATVVGIVAITGDSFSSYFEYSLHSASAMKGGSGQVAAAPFLLIFDIARFLQKSIPPLLISIFCLMSAFPSFAIRWIEKGNRSSTRDRVYILISIIAVECCFLFIVNTYCAWFLHTFPYFAFPNVTLPIFIIVLFSLAIVAAMRVLHILKAEDRLSILVLIPAGAMVAAAMSSGGDHVGLFGPIGLLLILLPLISTDFLTGRRREVALGAYALLGVTIPLGKALDPIEWQHYRAKAMFVDRKVIDSPIHGPMLVDREIDANFAQVCSTIREAGAGAGLVSMPYAYSNYYCGIAPWRGYVQTYFDTSSAATIGGLMRGLKESPPTWVVYQRQPKLLRASEVAFNHGQPIPHRALDEFIWGRIESRKWKVVRHWSDHPDSDWYFLRTSS